MSIAPFITIIVPFLFATGVAEKTPATSAVIDTVEIDRAVSAFTGKEIGQNGGAISPVDSRLRLAACAFPLALDWFGSPGRTVSVTCRGKNGWRVFVNVLRLQRTAETGPAIRRGETVTITIRGRGFTVQRQGEARSNGAIGDWIEVRVDHRSPTLRARIERPGLVVIENG